MIDKYFNEILLFSLVVTGLIVTALFYYHDPKGGATYFSGFANGVMDGLLLAMRVKPNPPSSPNP